MLPVRRTHDDLDVEVGGAETTDGLDRRQRRVVSIAAAERDQYPGRAPADVPAPAAPSPEFPAQERVAGSKQQLRRRGTARVEPLVSVVVLV